MTDIDRLYHKVKDRWGIRRTQVDATVKELEFLIQLLDMMEDDEFGKDNNVPASGWVSVKDRLPEEKGWYEVYAPSYTGGSSSGLDNHSGVMFAKWSGKTWSIEVGYHKRPGCVTHWKPITEPPKEGDSE